MDVRNFRGICLPQDRRNDKSVKMFSVEENQARDAEQRKDERLSSSNPPRFSKGGANSSLSPRLSASQLPLTHSGGREARPYERPACPLGRSGVNLGPQRAHVAPTPQVGITQSSSGQYEPAVERSPRVFGGLRLHRHLAPRPSGQEEVDHFPAETMGKAVMP
jgi:hypothetical protein